jgi:hypothetical protein
MIPRTRATDELLSASPSEKRLARHVGNTKFMAAEVGIIVIGIEADMHGCKMDIAPHTLHRVRHRKTGGAAKRDQRVDGAVQPKAPLYLASRRAETSAAVRKFLALVKRPANNV